MLSGSLKNLIVYVKIVVKGVMGSSYITQSIEGRSKNNGRFIHSML